MASGTAPSPSPAAGDVAFLLGAGVLFLASVAATIRLCSGMGGGMPMPGGWSLSMTWIGMAEQKGVGAEAAFTATWATMMVAMMLPALVPVLRRYRRLVLNAGGSGIRAALLAAAAYFAVWSALGAAIYPEGAALAAAAMRSAAFARAVPALAGVALLLAGAFQLTGWKARLLARCRAGAGCAASAPRGLVDAWRHGLDLGGHCALCCSGLMSALLVLGAMDLRPMTLVAAAITAERILPRPRLLVRATGLLLLAGGLLALVRTGATGW